MKMMCRKLISVFLLAAALLTVTGCRRKTADVDAAAVLEALLTQVQYETALTDVGDDTQFYFPDLPENSEIRYYLGNGYFADEVMALTLPRESDGEAAMKTVNNHLRELRKQYVNYIPEETAKIDQAVVCQKGRCIFLCVTADYETANRVLEQSIGSPAAALPEEQPGITEPPATSSPVSYPVLRSQSGTYHDYGTYTIRVDDCAYEQYTYVDTTAEAYAKLINRAAEALDGKTTVYALAIPTAIGVVLPDDIAAILPEHTDQGEAIRRIYDKLSDKVVAVDCFDNLMKHREEYLYFRTDHHWNGRGAYYAYEAFCKTKGIRAIGLEERTQRQFDGFLGALYQQNCSRDPILAEHPDTVEAYCPKSDRAGMRYTDRSGNTYVWDIISDVSQWDASAKYSTFAGADNPIAVFTNPDMTDGSVCVVVKESFGNALLPYLVDHYSTVYEIDYRYYEGNITDFALENHADDLIFANNLSMIGSDYLVGMLADNL